MKNKCKNRFKKEQKSWEAKEGNGGANEKSQTKRRKIGKGK